MRVLSHLKSLSPVYQAGTPYKQRKLFYIKKKQPVECEDYIFFLRERLKETM